MTKNLEFVIRPLDQSDLDAALALQNKSYPAFLCEDAIAFASRMALPSNFCLAAFRSNRLIAYLIAHGSAARSPFPVGYVLNPDDAGHDVLFIHDLCVSAAGRGSGVGRQLIDRAFELAVAAGLPRAELIAVEGAAGYWKTLGFVEEQCSPALAAKVASYGADARWMARDIRAMP
ncbi:GNAT family N-acetyltransferase [Sphingomonas crocodyli]|uniref:GNAT family N-acetyltransferase n=1 Tax=Sphingomonas crocodyli TaxID=1979270 RepID=A0A437M953_9SPHN|nr:GNAT family N-acetyltransferase [Sphingomonas crocodyli]RVT94241.1 GNAT family N-acetyltransferase [Sphingomonas crocodyli]